MACSAARCTSVLAIERGMRRPSQPWAEPRRQAAQIVYYDGQFDDARLNVTLACTAALAGAAVLNHASATSLIKVRRRA